MVSMILNRLTWVGLIGMVLCLPAKALEFQVEGTPPKVFIYAKGMIGPGDLRRLQAFALTLPAADKVLGVVLDSPGGNLLEAEMLAALARRLNFAAVVPPNAKCASACFLIFAGATIRFAAPNALIGVHSAADHDGRETASAMAFTTAMARDAAQFGVPAAIIGKMVSTEPGKMAWLTPSDLASMNVKPISTNQKQPMNSGAEPSISFHGTYTCIQGPTDLSIEYRKGLPSEGKEYLVKFGPLGPNYGTPSGSFIVEGQLDLAQGLISLSPVRWLSRPLGYTMIGFVGTSSDGGRTFSGRVTSGQFCTTFLIRRMQ